MAHKVHIGQQFGDFLAFENAIKKYQDAENVQFFKRDSRSLKAAKGRVSNKNFNEALKFYEVSYHCIRGGKNFKPRGTGKKETSTFRIGCKAHITVRASADGQKLEVKSLDEHHNHEVNRELFRNLYHQRRLDEVEKENIKQMLDMKANKKIIQSNVMQSTGKVLLLKDIHNIKRSDAKNNDCSTLQNAVNELNRCNGAYQTVIAGAV